MRDFSFQALLSLTALFPISFLLSQTPPNLQTAGFFYKCSPGGSGRGVTGQSTELLRIGKLDYRGWGVSSTDPTSHIFYGIQFVVQDQLCLTRETLTLVGYEESSSKPHYPDTSKMFFGGVKVTLPPGFGAKAFLVTAVFNTPAKVKVGQDVFIGATLPPAPIPYIDGLSIHFVRGVTYSKNDYDLAGPGLPSTKPLNCYGHTLSSTRNDPVEVQWHFDPLLKTASGVATATTNQSRYTVSAKKPGTASFFSGLHPDAASPPKNAGRMDSVGFRILDKDLANDPVVFFYSTNFSIGNLFFGGLDGCVCIDITKMQIAGMKIADSNGEAWIHVDLGPMGNPIRRLIRGAKIVWFAIGIDKNLLRASPCAMQRF